MSTAKNKSFLNFLLFYKKLILLFIKIYNNNINIYMFHQYNYTRYFDPYLYYFATKIQKNWRRFNLTNKNVLTITPFNKIKDLNIDLLKKLINKLINLF